MSGACADPEDLWNSTSPLVNRKGAAPHTETACGAPSRCKMIAATTQTTQEKQNASTLALALRAGAKLSESVRILEEAVPQFAQLILELGG